MRLEASILLSSFALLRLARALCLCTALVVAPSGCSQDGERPARADLPELLLEAVPTENEPVTDGSPARRAVRDALRHVLETEKKCGAEIDKRFWRQELSSSYLLRDEAFIGGTFPLGTAALLREVQEFETKYLTEHQDFPKGLAENLAKNGVSAKDRQAIVDEMSSAFAAQRRPILAAIETHQKLVEAIAELYELVGSQPKSIRAMREGLEITDEDLLESFNSQVDTVNSAIDATNLAVQRLDADQRRIVYWMHLIEQKRR